ncbi:MAG: type II secretion system protein GspE [Deltaproteobacteria bacterium CG11_big_fil_rev_8_21_14_0_20_47_16]|nr:MAG: type II secretion system protein GspE [Deltaproteobacteria bacterium CG11_big_fil_rev_8_21_14_0_20_47_16]
MPISSSKVEEIARDLVETGVLTQDQLAVAIESQKNLGGNLADILVSRRFVTESDLIRGVGKRSGTVVVSLTHYNPDLKLLKRIKAQQAEQWQVIPLFEVEDKITAAIVDPFNLSTMDEVRTALSQDVDFVLATPSDIQSAIQRWYSSVEEALPIDGKIDIEVVRYEHEETSSDDSTESPLAKLEREAEGARVVAAANNVLIQAYKERASDIHLEPLRDSLKIRLRIDGMLEELQALPKSMHKAVISRIKIMGGMDVAENRIPQDGRVRVKVGGREMDLRIATYPTMFGEAVAIRLLIKEQVITLEALGFLERDLEIFSKTINKPHGIFLVTGPTGSGKTTTLYAALHKIDRKAKHVLSVEDPVEHEIEGVDQTQINLKAGVTFAGTIRAMMREDPDVIMVGEIRDQETADITFRAAMTGHLVFSTLHTNTAVGAIARLIDLGVEPFLISSSLLGVMAQRLVRRICPNCKMEVELSSYEKQLIDPQGVGIKAYKGRGCKDCRMSGYRGRVGLFELVALDDEFRVLINTRAPEVRMREKATSAGFHTILDDGIEKVRRGITTVEEVLRVTAEV